MVEGYTLTVADAIAAILNLQLNSSGKGLFESLAVPPEGGLTAGWFTPDHAVVVTGDNLAGYTVANGFVQMVSINDSGQIALLVTDAAAPSLGTAIILATPRPQQQ